jgi:hypothetical protein
MRFLMFTSNPLIDPAWQRKAKRGVIKSSLNSHHFTSHAILREGARVVIFKDHRLGYGRGAKTMNTYVRLYVRIEGRRRSSR